MAVGMEIIFWFFFGEQVGRRHFSGYLVRHTYIAKADRKKLQHGVVPDKKAL